MNFAYGFFQYYAAVLILLTLLSGIGYSVINLFSRKIETKDPSVLLLAPIHGIAFLSIFTLVVANLNVAISSSLVWTAVITIVAFSVFKSSPKIISGGIFKFKTGSKVFGLYGLATVIGLAPYLHLMVHEKFTSGFGTSASWTNNDLGAYIQMATNIVAAGHADAGFVVGWDAGSQASFDHPAAQTFFAGASQLLFRSPFQMGIVVMSVILASLFLATISVAQALGNVKSAQLLVGLGFVVINPAIISATSNFFFAQLLAITLTMGIFASFLSLTRNSSSQLHYSSVPIMSVAALLVSVEIAVVMIPMVWLFSTLMTSRKSLFGHFKKTLISHVIVIGLALILLRGVLESQINVLRRTTVVNIAGWESNYTSISALLGFAPTQLGGPYSDGTRFLDALIILVFVFIVGLGLFRGWVNRPALMAVAVLAIFLAVAFVKWGSTSYQTWKLISTLFPFFAVLVFSIKLETSSLTSSPIRNVLPLLVVGLTFSWSGFIWKDVQLSSFINPDVSEVALSEAARRQPGINVALSPFFETMAMSVVSGIPSHMVSPTYQFSAGQDIKYSCTLTTKDRLASLPNVGPIVHQRGEYVLVGTPRCD